MSVAREIRAEMARQHMTYIDLSNKTEIDHRKLLRTTSQETQPLTIPDMNAIAKALNLRVSDLIIRAEENAQEVAA